MRLDDVVTIAQEAINSRKIEWGDGTLILGVPKLRKVIGEGTELLVAASENDLLPYRIDYFVTVHKFPWLKDSGQDASSIIWIATEVERVTCPGPAH